MEKTFPIFLLLFVTLLSHATDYVASTVEEAISLFKNAKAGDCVLLKNGTYKNETIKLQNTNGTEAQQITFAVKLFSEVVLKLSFA